MRYSCVVNEILENHAANRVKSLIEIAELVGEDVYLVSQAASLYYVEDNRYRAVYYSQTYVKRWRVDGFGVMTGTMMDSSLLICPLVPPYSDDDRREIFNMTGDYSQDEHFRDAFRLSTYNVRPRPPHRDVLTSNFAVFRSNEGAQRYRVALTLLFDPPPPNLVFETIQKFRTTRFPYTLFSHPKLDVSEQSEQDAKSIMSVF